MYLAIDIGGTKTTLASFAQIDPRSQLDSLTYPTPPIYLEALNHLQDNCQKITGQLTPTAIGISIASRLKPDKSLSNSGNLKDYHGHNLITDFSKITNNSIFLENDAACAARAEMTYGHGQNQNSLIHFIMGTGFGGAYINRSPHSLTLIPLSPGSVIIEPGGMPHTQKPIKGLFESYLGGSQIEAQISQPLKNISNDHYIWQRVANYLGLAAYNFSKLFSVELITVSGGLIQHRPFIIDKANQALNQYPNTYPHPHLYLTAFENNASLIGALTLCQE